MKIAPIKNKGFADLDAQLASIGRAMATEIAENAVKASAEVLRKAWEAGAPFDPAKGGASGKYGHLRENMRVKFVKSANANVVAYAVTTGRAFWAVFLEFGTRKLAARPWARPIRDRVEPAIIAKQIEVINAGIASAAAKKGEA